jgi:hypothetical protein
MSVNSVNDTALNTSRRRVLLGSVAIFGSYFAGASLPSFALPAADDAQLTRFMQLSRLLVNHQLDPKVGARILKTAAKERADLKELTDTIMAIAEQKQAKIVEDFFGDIPDGKAMDLAKWVIFAWYSGVSSPKANAVLFTYEQALTFQTTIDVVTIPSYGISGPNQWRQVTVPLSAMPSF